MADITPTKFHDIEKKIYAWVMRMHDPRWKLGYRSIMSEYSQETVKAVEVAMEMVKVFSKIQQAYAEERIDREALTAWLMQLEATPMELSVIIEEIEENKFLTYESKRRTIKKGEENA